MKRKKMSEETKRKIGEAIKARRGGSGAEALGLSFVNTLVESDAHLQLAITKLKAAQDENGPKTRKLILQHFIAGLEKVRAGENNLNLSTYAQDQAEVFQQAHARR